jgi:hypothetical protein
MALPRSGSGAAASHRLYLPRPTTVRLGPDGVPTTVGRDTVDAVREEWLVEDRWWTDRPLRRRYLELTTVDGADRVVFVDLGSERWFAQRGG